MRVLGSLLIALVVAACGDSGHDPGHGGHAPPPPTTTVPSQPATPHGSHDPAHGGHVLMDATYHVELVLDPEAGRHRAYVSDGARAPLPASTFDKVELTVAGEALAMTRAADDSAWEVAGQPAPSTGAKVSIAYFKGGAQVARFDDLPVEYVLTGKMPVVEAADPVKPPAHGPPGHHH